MTYATTTFTTSVTNVRAGDVLPLGQIAITSAHTYENMTTIQVGDPKALDAMKRWEIPACLQVQVTRTTSVLCDGWCDKTADVTHLDNKGYVYCAPCGDRRKSGSPCRKLTKAEIATIERGEPIARY